MDGPFEREEFQRKFAAALARSPPAEWYEIWVLLWEDSWFQSELTKKARFFLSCGDTPLDWLPDVRHEAMLNLSAKLRKKPTLGLNATGFDDGFPKVMRGVIRNVSMQALKRLRRIYRTGAGSVEESELRAAWDRYERSERSLELSAAINDLPEPFCSALRFFLLGDTIHEISRRMGCEDWEAYRVLRHGIEQIRRDLLSA